MSDEQPEYEADAGVSARWPHAEDVRAIPTHAYRGATPDATAALRDLLYLDEVERQARIFTSSFAEAMDAALVRDDAEETWRQLQSAMFAAIVVNRLLDARGQHRGWNGVSNAEAERIAKARAERLRQLLLIPDPSSEVSPVYAVRNVRDSMEHIDQRLDRVSQDADKAGGVSDWYLSDGRLLVTRQVDFPEHVPLGLRAFVPTSGMIFFNDSSLSLFALDLDMLALQHHVNEARKGMVGRLRGGNSFGGSQLVEFSDRESRLRALVAWERERANRVRELENVTVTGVTLWVRPEDATSCSDTATLPATDPNN
jgi:hypothetical protein